jgi:hypothetical protein
MRFKPQSRASLGIVYLCLGELYAEFAERSLWHLRRFGYSGPVRVIGDIDLPAFRLDDCEFIEVPPSSDSFSSRHYKTQINKFGWETTLFLDADAIPVAPLGHIWRELRFADLCLSMDLHPTVEDLVTRSVRDRDRREVEYRHMTSLGLAGHPFFSSGVMLFRRTEEVERLFSLWHEEWNLFQDEDQLALARAIRRTGLHVHKLAPRWNARLSNYGSVETARLAGVRILHLRPALEALPFELTRASA